jgi:homeobox-leucine zipper protein
MPIPFAIACMFELTWLFELLPQRRWSDMFSCIVAKAATIEEISPGVAGSRNGALLLVSVEYP